MYNGAWYIRWLYPSSSEPPPPLAEEVPFVDGRWEMPQFPKWQPLHDSYFLGVFEPDIPYFASSWSMVWGTHFVEAVYTDLEVEEQQEFFLDNEWRMPFYPVWIPPYQTYEREEEEFPHPEVDRIDIPIWVPWRPIPHLDYFNDLEEEITIDKWENPWRLPVHPIPQLRFPWISQEDEPLPEIGTEYIPSMHLLPPQPSYFQPPDQFYFNDLPSPPPKCPPPCLRRPDTKC